ncbi:hypothetical protein L1887_22565 [Cichorium endivia]|nr:hypothetical protein L1887_22565 [Cichorium endivia]
MDVNIDMLSPNYLYLRDTPIRAYIFFKVRVEEDHPFPNSDILLRCLQNYLPVHYPYVWLVYENEAAIVDFDDMYEYYIGQQPPSSSTTTIQQPQTRYVRHTYEHSDEIYSIRQAINESFEEAASHVPCSGLTKKLISKNLRVAEYCEEEEGEICVVCQDEFKSKQRVGVLQCKHQYHPRCIKEWLVRHNVCPLCKAQALTL